MIRLLDGNALPMQFTSEAIDAMLALCAGQRRFIKVE